jgi:hypothetical protein
MAGFGNEVGWWCPSLDTAGNGTTTLTDLAGSNTGTLLNMEVGSDWVSDTANNGVMCLALDGTNEAIQLASDIAISTSWSVGMWVKPSTIAAGLRFAFSKRDPQRIYIGHDGSSIYLRVGTDSGSISGGTINTTDWCLVGLTIDSATAYTGWVNGASVGSRSTTMSTSSGTGIGAYFDNQTSPLANYFAGRVDDVRVFSRVLSAPEWAAWYAGGRGYSALLGSRRRRQSVSGGVL